MTTIAPGVTTDAPGMTTDTPGMTTIAPGVTVGLDMPKAIPPDMTTNPVPPDMMTRDVTPDMMNKNVTPDLIRGLMLVNQKNCLPLAFDCGNCEMVVLAPQVP